MDQVVLIRSQHRLRNHIIAFPFREEENEKKKKNTYLADNNQAKPQVGTCGIHISPFSSFGKSFINQTRESRLNINALKIGGLLKPLIAPNFEIQGDIPFLRQRLTTSKEIKIIKILKSILLRCVT